MKAVNITPEQTVECFQVPNGQRVYVEHQDPSGAWVKTAADPGTWVVKEFVPGGTGFGSPKSEGCWALHIYSDDGFKRKFALIGE